MKKAEMIEEIRRLHAEMENLIVESGIKAERYKALLFELEKKKAQKVKELYSFLSKIRVEEYQYAHDIKRLLPQETWDNYRMFGCRNLREQVMLTERLKLLRTAWHKRGKNEPAKTKPATKSETTESSRPEVPA